METSQLSSIDVGRGVVAEGSPPTVADEPEDHGLLPASFAKAHEMVVSVSHCEPVDAACSPRDVARMVAFNKSTIPTVHHNVQNLIAHQASIRPYSPAINSWDERLTYRELDRLSSILAVQLRQLGARPWQKSKNILFCFNKSAWAVVTLLGILKAGAAFVPLNPQDPIERRLAISQQVQAEIIVTSQGLASECSSLADTVIEVSRQTFTGTHTTEVLDAAEVSPSDIAYVMFTSGSTGTPKGVVIEHTSFRIAMKGIVERFGLSRDSRVLQFASYSFDASLAEIFGSLVSGGSVCIPSDDMRMNNVTEAIKELDANWLILTPPVARTINPDDVPGVQFLALIGEGPSRGDLELWGRRTRLVNGYGPTETCICCATYQWKDIHDNPRCIGNALNCTAWVVHSEDHHSLTPIGCVGELVIEGPLLARGYLNDHEHTEAAFFTDPTWGGEAGLAPGSRFYKTGDLVRYMDDGLLEFVGRKDFQIKINGQRVESSEVEHQFSASFEPARDVLVSCFQNLNSHGKTTLAAFFTRRDIIEQGVSGTGIEPMTGDLRQALHQAVSVLRTKLPRHMVPSYFLPVREFPASANGKTSRDKLHDWFAAVSSDNLLQYAVAESSPQRAVSTPMEKILQTLWSEILEVDASTIWANDNFLLKGGESISAIRLVKLARDAGIELSVGLIFDHPVLSHMAMLARARQGNADEAQSIAPFSLLSRDYGRQALLDRLARECNIRSDEIEDSYPCTPLQEGLMALSSKQPGTYTAQFVFRLPENVELLRLKEAWRMMVENTAILRTRIALLEEDTFVQVVSRQSPRWASGSDLKVFLRQDLDQHMLLGTSLSRYALIEDEESRFFVWTIHHAAYDGWSVQLILDGVRQLYHGLALPDGTPFAHMVAYTLSQRQDDASTAEFWRSQLEGCSAPTFPRLPSINYHPRARASFRHRFSAQRMANSAVTLPTVFKSAWALLLGKYSDSSDIIFGLTSSGRQTPLDGVESIVGPLIATIPVRLKTSPSEPLVDFLDRVQQHSNALVPFEQTGLQTIAKISDDTRRACQFQTLLVIQPDQTQDNTTGEAILAAVNPDDLDLEGQLHEAFHTYSLVFECAIVKNEVVVNVMYDQNVLAQPAIEAMCHHFSHIVHQMLDPSARGFKIQEISMFSQFDEQKILGWKGRPPTPVWDCLHQLIERQAIANPKAAAISAWDASMSYEEFDLATSGLAQHLVANGVIVDSFVPICFEKSAMAIVSMIAVMKAGAAYVPLDPSHPIARQQIIMKQTQARLILGSAATSSRCTDLAQIVVQVDGELINTCLRERREQRRDLPDVSPRGAAYVLFTSGSTGTPKGLVMEHVSACTAQIDIVGRLQLQPHSRVLQFAAFVFDLCISEIFAPLLAGACICIPSEYDRLNNTKEFIRDQEIDWAFLTPTFARLFTPEDLPGLRYLVLAGEVVGQDILQTWVGKVQLWNGWGPSECCCFSTLNECKTDTESPLNLGYDVGGVCWIVEPDDLNTLVPIGCAGEIVIQGAPISREYLQSPELTQAAYIDASPRWLPNTDSPLFSRIFKTGDLGRFNSDGTIEFIGRKDTQVKIRGFRVELGEIEHHIKAQSRTQQVAVELVQTEHDKRASILVAYLCFSRNSGDVSETQFSQVVQSMHAQLRDELVSLSSALATRMPKYMVPDVFLPLERMPVITSTKLDRACLRRLASSLSKQQLASYSLTETLSHRREPSTEVEQRMASIWSKVLNVPIETIGKDDNFLKIGGDSIAAIRLVTAARENGILLTVADIFNDPRLCQMSLTAQYAEENAEYNREGLPGSTEYAPFDLLKSPVHGLIDLVAQQCGVTTDQIEDAYPCTPLQDGMMALTARQPGSYIATRTYRISDTVDLDLFQQAWADTVRACPNLRTRIVLDEDITLQAIVKDAPKLEIGPEVTLKSSIAALRNMPMGYGSPLCRYTIFNDQNSSNMYFIIVIHHSIYDGHSFQNVLKAFFESYEGIYSPQAPPYAKFIQYVLDLDSKDASEYWNQQLRGAKQASFPPYPRLDARKEGATRCLTHRIGLKPMSGAAVTKASVLRAAWAVVLARHCDSNDVCFGVTVSGRHAPVTGIVGMMGPAVATIPVRIHLNPDCPTVTFIEDVQRHAVEMTPYEQFGLQRISKLGPDAENACRFSSLLVVQPAEYMRHPVDGNSSSILLPHQPGSLDETMQDYFTFPLVIQCLLMPDDTVDLFFVYEADVLTEYQVSALASQLGHTVEQLTTLETRPLKQLSVCGPRDLELASKLNIETPETIRSTYHQLVEEQARLRPGSLAVDAWDKTFTYHELDQAANRLAHRLVASGVQRGDFVLVCLEKSAWYIVAILGVNKAGAAWLPMEPTSSQISRQRLQVQQTNAKVALASGSTRNICEKLVDEVIEVTAGLEDELDCPRHAQPPAVDVSSTDAAYILFTSGSTGTPKGLVMDHLAVCTSQTAVAKRLRFTSDVRLLQFASYVFDLSVGELVAPLISGACICIPPEGTRLNHHALCKFAREFRVNWAFFTPAFARILDPDDFPSLQLLLLAGEAVTRDVFSKWFGRLRLLNGWGPAETCVFSTLHEYVSDSESTVTIGTPVGGHCWVVESEDEHGFHLAPHGCVGEIIVHSPTVLREYVADEDKTRASVSERLPAWSSLQSKPWNRCFRTGDLGFINGIGFLEYSGRKDTQVKINGMRVELGEVEQQLYNLLPDARQVVVDVLRQETATSLVAFFCLSTDTRNGVREAQLDDMTNGSQPVKDSLFLPVTSQLRDRLSDLLGELNLVLPRYMIPTLFIPCQYMPVITSTKIDRGGLLRRAGKLDQALWEAYSLQGHKRAPETAMELRLGRIWAEILDRSADSIGRDDAFLGIGGDSIMAIQLVAASRKQGISISVQDIFRDSRLTAVSAKATAIEPEQSQLEEIPQFSLLPPSLREKIKERYSLQDQLELEDAYPCTPLQEGLMSLAVKQPGSYVAKFSFELPKDVDIPRFKRAWEMTLEAHASLRARLVLCNDTTTIQTVVRGGLEWEEDTKLDLESAYAAASGAKMGYDTPMCRFGIVIDPSGDKYFFWVVHHAIYDGLSMVSIIRTLSDAYYSRETPVVPTYSRFIKHVLEINPAAAAQYWKRELRGVKQASFPPRKQPSQGDKLAKTRILKHTIELTQPVGVSLTKATIVRAAWTIVLARYSNTNDVCFGATVSGRQASLPGIESMVGPMISTVPVRIRLDRGQNMTARGFLQDIQTQALDMVPFEQYGLHRISRLDQDTAEACNFSSLFVIQPSQVVDSHLLPYQKEPLLVPTKKENSEVGLQNYFTYPLVVQSHLNDSDTDLYFVYDSQVLAETQISAMAKHVEQVVKQLQLSLQNLDHDTPLSAISVAGEWDIEQAMQLNSDDTEIVHGTVHGLFEKQVLCRPDAVAIDAWDATFTYAQLNQAANRLAHHLMEDHHVHVGDLVHVLFQKSAWYVVAVLAINKAGAAWVPLEPSHPLERHLQVVRQTGSKLALASAENLATCEKLVPVVVEVGFSTDKKLATGSHTKTATGPECTVGPGDAAYALFTSGSTGAPKGFVMEHGAVCTSQTAISRRLDLQPERGRMLQLASYVFDLSIGETIATLISGGTVCVPSEEARLNNIGQFIRERNVNWAILTPSFARTLSPDDVPNLELLVLAGEPVGYDLFNRWFGRVRLFNGWGPAETCVFSSLHEYKSADESPLTVGRPVGGYCWIVNPEDQTLAPTGCIGEVMIQGPTLLREYLADRQMTEATIMRSLPDWAPMQSSASWPRFYKSGDLCFINSRGALEFNSRKDNQVKIRGLRVELGEVEYCIRQALPDLLEVAVDVHRTEVGTNLVAFLHFSRNEKSHGRASSQPLFLPTTPHLRERINILVGKLSITLPDYMIPTFFVPCSTIPFIASTKIDRAGLRAGLARVLTEKKKWDMYALQKNQKRKPETPMEHKMTLIWGNILNIDAEFIGRDDSFLRLGGDSVTAIHLVAAAREQGIRLTVKTIFDDARLLAVSARSRVVDDADGDAAIPAPFSLLTEPVRQLVMDKARMPDGQSFKQKCSVSSAEDIEDAFPCTPMQQGLMALTVKQPGSYISTHVYKLAEHVDEQRFRLAWQKTIAACSNLRTRIVLCGTESVQVIVNSQVTWTDVSEGTDLQKALHELQFPHMGYGNPLCRYRLIRESHGLRYFAFALHHAIFDGWTLQLVLESLFNFYEDLEGCKPNLQPYSGFVKHVIGADQEAAKSYWQSELQDAKPMALPWTPNPARATNVASRSLTGKSFKIPQSLASTSITKATVLRAAWSLMLARYSESDDVCFGATNTGRQAPVRGIQAMPGMTIATVPIRVRIDHETRDRPASEFLQDIQRQATEMVAYEQYGLQNIARLGTYASDACSFSSLLVIQPVQHFTSAYRRHNSEGETILDFGVTEQSLLESNAGNSLNYPLVFVCELGQDNEVGLHFYYDAGVLNEAQLEAMSHQFEHVVQQLVSEEDVALGSISLVGPREVQQAVAQNGNVPDAKETCTHWIIQEKCRMQPDATAISGWDGNLTYSRLLQLASRLALKLQHLGLSPEDIIPLYFHKSAWAAVAMVAVQMAGAAFVTLDIGAPLSRNKGIVDDVNAMVLLTSPDQRDTAVKLGAKTVLDIDEDGLEALPHSGSLKSTAQPSNASYVVFTSGSTGRPKGIVVDHKAACTGADAYGSAANIGPGTRVFQFSSIVFDAGIFDNLGTLMRGGCVCIPSDHDRLNNLAHAMNASRANFAFLTPTVADMLSPAAVTGLKTLALGGEAVGQKTVDRWTRHVKTIGVYGPAEATTVSAINLRLGKTGKSTNIGRPLSSAYWVVKPDNPRQLVPLGCVGELLIQGPLLARGYIGLGKEDKSAAAWLDNVDWFSKRVGGRAYLTGDLVRRMENGTFDFVGRKDTQVKVHGQRVELGEIEAVMLAALPEHLTGIVDVVVSDPENPAPDALMAFIWSVGPEQNKTLKLPHGPSEEEAKLISSLYGSLGVSLPSYMVPVVYLCLEGAPEQAVSGKVSRRSLMRFAQAIPADQRLRFTPGEMRREPPSTPMELDLRDIWARVLKVNSAEIGKQSNFLRLGGDSLSAIQLVTLARDQGIDLTVRRIFHDPRLVGMGAAATRITRIKDQGEAAPQEAPFSMLEEEQVDHILAQIQSQCGLSSPDQVEDAYPCTAAQAAYMSDTVQQPFSRVAKHAFPLTETVDLERFKWALEQTVAMCTILRTRIVLTDKKDSAGRSAVQAVLRNQFQWEQGLGHLDLRPAIETMVSHGMGYGKPLCRFAVVHHKTTGGRVFVMVVHHSLYDGWIVKMFYRMLNDIYLGLPTIPTTSFTSFVRYTLDIDKSETHAYWRKQLQGAKPAQFPSFLRAQRRAIPTHSERTILIQKTITFPEQRQTAITKATIFRAAWAIMLARNDNTNDVTFGAVSSGRKAPLEGASSTLGPAIAYVPVRVRLPDPTTTTTTEFLQQLQLQAADMVAHEQYGVDRISRVNADAEAVCQFRQILIVQPLGMLGGAAAAAFGNDDEDEVTNSFDEDTPKVSKEETIFEQQALEAVAAAYSPEESLQGFNDIKKHPVILHCYLGRRSANLNFLCQDGAVTAEEISDAARQLEDLVDRLSVEGTLLSTVISAD